MAISDVNTGGTTMGWMSDPNGRGTISLLTSCLLTLGLCVWSAMHLDIPPRRASPASLFLLYLKWGIIGVLGPELVVYVAWRQLNSARTLKREMEETMCSSGQEKSDLEYRDPSRSMRTRCSLMHGFFGSMGGYAFDLERRRNVGLANLFPKLRRLTVTAKGVALLAKCGLLPELSREEIQDKNKADHLAKTVMCIQAGWFLVQTFARVGQHMHVTLLEVNTLAHVGCTMLLYVLWWNKPSMVYEPVYLEGDWVPAVCSYMYMSSQISIWERDRPSFSRKAWLDSELSALTYVSGPARASSAKGYLQPTAYLPPSTSKANNNPFKSTQKVAQPSTLDLLRWSLAAQAISQHPCIAEQMVPSPVSTGTYTFAPAELVTEYSSNWPSEALLRGTEGLIMGMILWSASMGFGAIHLAAWREHFPTVIEGWLWRGSAAWITTSGALWMGINLLAKTVPWVNAFWDDVVALRAGRCTRVLLGLVCAVCGLAYLGSRLFLVLEAFISLRALPASAFETPSWSQLFPHF